LTGGHKKAVHTLVLGIEFSSQTRKKNRGKTLTDIQSGVYTKVIKLFQKIPSG